jgi:hypothetical protein
MMYGWFHVTIIWIDGKEEKLSVQSAHVKEGVLQLETERGKYRHIPLANIREWKEDRD